MKKIAFRLLPFMVFILLVYFFMQALTRAPDLLPSTQIGKSIPSFSLPLLTDEDGPNDADVFQASDMRGQVSLLNIWASWCSACMNEQIFLMELAHDGFPVYGLNYKDSAKNARDWLREWGNPYRLIGQDLSGKTGIDLGVYGTPETFLIDKQGIIRYRHVGVLDEASWRQEFLPRIQQLAGKK